MSLLASRGSNDGTSNQLAALNDMLQHIEVQEKLPLEVVEAANMDCDTMPPLSPQRIVEVNFHSYRAHDLMLVYFVFQLFVGELNPASSEKHFLLALEYLHFASAVSADSQ